MQIMALAAADFVVLFLYFAVIVVIGLVLAKKIKRSDDYFMPRKFGKIMMITFSFGTGTHSDQAVSVAAKSFTNGLSGIWYQWLWLPVTPFYWLIAPMFRRFRAITTADVFKARYNQSVAILFSLVGMANLAVSIGVMLKGSSEVISASMEGFVSANVVIAIMTAIFVFYGVAGGLAAAIVTDFIQGILTVFFSFLLLPLIFNAIGGFEGLRESLGGTGMLSIVAPAEIGVFYVAVIAFNALVGIVTQPHTMGNCAAGKTEMDGRVGFMGGNILKRICTVPWCLIGVAGVIYFAGTDIHPDRVFGAVAGDFLPKLVPGLIGLFVASILATVMSSCDAFMISSSALFTENVYRPLVPDRDHSHYIKVGRITAVFIVASGVTFAYWLPSVVRGLEIFWKISPMMAIAFWMGLFWRRTTVYGAWAATLTAFAAWWLSSQAFFVSFLQNLSFAESIRLVFQAPAGPEMYLPWQMIFYLLSGLIAGTIVSWLTKPVAHEKLENFYALIRTPVKAGEQPPGVCQLPPDAVVPPKRTLLPNTNLEIPIPTWTSIIGFLVGWAIVAAIIWVVFYIAVG